MSDQPHWKANFPIRQADEHEVSRRQFCKVACGSALAVGAGWLARDKLFPVPAATQPKLVGRIEEVPVGGYKLFRYPTEHQPCILVRLSENQFVAYSQSCTHLMCPVNYQHEKRQFYCPCHEGFFSAEDGRVLAGPPPRPLPSYPVEIRAGEIWVNPAIRGA
ncbi:Rieske (2Fe-2S) domain protein [Chthoniobacter flavus Ellin428]|uniref:Rieske (2Fe-2S) domain protein n=1 Tax=Chthoniobacter flavus Ellin428 TaxID=497964 RepID=B4DAB1_9BACT|nr:Rieske 2Fe-2S domain-containing protein [Chthoniobacter flavus]EDY16572.1 Rieske (2Fe-2S) domain protein [Chthoniobacter flavus Ellin428]TCO92005.1 Rieske Fe-S protein [Chthoniobacter flavus]